LQLRRPEEWQQWAREIVELIRSDNPQILLKGFVLFEDAFRWSGATDIESNRRVKMHAIREMQAIVLSENGALLRKLLGQMLSGRDEDFLKKGLKSMEFRAYEAGRLLGLEFWSAAVISTMCMSVRFAKIVLRLGSEERIFNRLAACLHRTKLFVDSPPAAGPVNSLGLRALCYLGRASKRFRGLIRGDPRIFSSIFHLLSKDESCSSPLDGVIKDKHASGAVTLFLRTFAACEGCKDSHAWLIEQGFCEAMVKVISQNLPGQLHKMNMMVCTESILALLEEEPCRQLLKERGAIRTWLPISGMLQAQRPCPGLWNKIKQVISRPQSGGSPCLNRCADDLRRHMECATGANTFCSWPRCEMEDTILRPYKELKKSARCKSAHYCRFVHCRLQVYSMVLPVASSSLLSPAIITR
jgi:hypothetical protein